MKEVVAQGNCNINSVLRKKITEKIMMSQQKAQTVSPSYFYFLIKKIPSEMVKNTIRDGLTAPRWDCLHCLHCLHSLKCLHCLHYFNTLLTLLTLLPLLTLLTLLTMFKQVWSKMAIVPVYIMAPRTLSVSFSSVW